MKLDIYDFRNFIKICKSNIKYNTLAMKLNQSPVQFSKIFSEKLDYDFFKDFFNKESSRLFEELGAFIDKIEHVGSTSIKNMCGTKIPDAIIFLKPDIEFNNEIFKKFINIGYNFMSMAYHITPNDVWLSRKNENDEKYLGFVIHVMNFEDKNSEKLIGFRDLCNKNEDTRLEYYEKKMSLFKSNEGFMNYKMNKMPKNFLEKYKNK